MSTKTDWIQAGSVAELREKGATVVRGGIAVFSHEGKIHAVDNRCPHLGFPLHMGSLCDGILTCHWHHARFDVCSGGTLDPWADDVPSYEVKIEDEQVYVNPRPRSANHIEKYKERLMEGLQQNISIVIAKAVVGLVEAGVSDAEIARIGIQFGTENGNGWNSGLTILTAMVRIIPKLDKQGRILALYQGLVHVARNSSGRASRHLLGALPSADVSFDRLAGWYRNCIEVRDTQGAEKLVITAIDKGMSLEKLADMMLIAATDHFYLDGGHVFDFHNKAFEALELADEGQANRILTSLLHMMGNPTRSEEQHHWQAPINLVEPIQEAVRQLAESNGAGAGEGKAVKVNQDENFILEQLLSEQPLQTIELVRDLLLAGMAPAKLAQLVTLAAAERVVRFHTQNDFRDWVAVLHTFTYAHAVHERLLHSEEPLLQRAILHGAISVYLDRFLNVPAAKRPKVAESNDDAAVPGMDELLQLLDQRQQVDRAAGWVANYLHRGGEVPALLNTLGAALLREDAEFHTFQMFEASVAEYERWSTRQDAFALRAQETMLLACTRYLAAHAPTARELPHTATIAWRLHRGERLFEE
ncbi:nitrite reductase/ring-hydroxylating ferredoxin subunit [Paenibacillus taihuensis]|uniref:Nitrite reductase/ring-hydroxylating ferredoxin subunit n=1 Tax=Paenibacillus taihuensis TaxID=1156355 RepID=A0A3D9SC69_9BACL|nr:Rieske 2Fe-2S domain-containing protein [Paenibacillus taihuensis]REE86116.1 nitrite reductase/ring-hydroxylating ferredoxin subunit [Paenibacillus taihuensis]